MVKLLFPGLCGLLLLLGCTHSGHRTAPGGIIIDTRGVNMTAYAQDLSDCQIFADQVNTGQQVASATARGAVVGGAIGAIVGDSGTAGRGAGAGGVLGAAKGLGQAQREKQQVLRQCLRGRGYRVLN